MTMNLHGLASPITVMRRRFIAYILIVLALLFMSIQVVVLSDHEDTERIMTAEQPNAMTITQPGEDTFFVCTSKNSDQKPPETLEVELNPERDENGQLPPAKLNQIKLSDPRPLTLPGWFAEKYQIDAEAKCGMSEQYLMEPGTIITDPPNNAVVIQAHSSRPVTPKDVVLFLSFFACLMAGLILWSMRPNKLPRLKYYDGIAAFILALGMAYLVTVLTGGLEQSEEKLFPGYMEMFSMMLANFSGFLLAALAVIFWRAHKEHKKLQVSSEKEADDVRSSETPSDPTPLPKSRPHVTIGIGVLLALTAAITVSFAPMPGLNTAEMASVLVSTRFITAHFAILAGICEECLFRGVIQTSFMARPGSNHPLIQNAIAILIATFLFVLLHVPQSVDHLWALIPIALVSIVSGIIRIRSKSIFQSILLHTTYNATLLMPSLLMPTTVF